MQDMGIDEVGLHQRVAKYRQESDDDALHKAAATEGGRALLWYILEGSGVDTLSYSEAAHDTSFREGRRSIGVALLKDIRRVVPLAEEQMRREARQREEWFKARAEGVQD